MDADRFDTLLRHFSAMPSRREALRVISGLGLAGLLGQAGVAAKHKHKKKK